MDEFAPRKLYVLFGNTDGSYTIVGSMSLIEYWMGGVFGDPLSSVAIEGGALCISTYGGSSDRWGSDMCYIYDEGQLILAYERAYFYTTNTSDEGETIYDYINYTVEHYEINRFEDTRTLVSSEILTDARYVFGSED